MAVADPNPKPEILSRKQRRRQKAQSSPIEIPKAENEPAVISLTTLTISRPAMASTRLLVCSIGNPAPYLNTLHSAGHTVLNSLAQHLSYPSFQKSRAHGNGLVSAGTDYTLWQSSSLMNISGPGVLAAWKQFNKESRGEKTRLIVVHDEMELAFGKVKSRNGSLSAKGHRGLLSIGDSLRGMEYMRIGVGIGRPQSREPDLVARYVLRPMTGWERGLVEGCAGVVLRELERLEGS